MSTLTQSYNETVVKFLTELVNGQPEDPVLKAKLHDLTQWLNSLDEHGEPNSSTPWMANTLFKELGPHIDAVKKEDFSALCQCSLLKQFGISGFLKYLVPADQGSFAKWVLGLYSNAQMMSAGGSQQMKLAAYAEKLVTEMDREQNFDNMNESDVPLAITAGIFNNPAAAATVLEMLMQSTEEDQRNLSKWAAPLVGKLQDIDTSVSEEELKRSLGWAPAPSTFGQATSSQSDRKQPTPSPGHPQQAQQPPHQAQQPQQQEQGQLSDLAVERAQQGATPKASLVPHEPQVLDKRTVNPFQTNTDEEESVLVPLPVDHDGKLVPSTTLARGQASPSSSSQVGPNSSSQPVPRSSSQPGPSSAFQVGPSSANQPVPSSSSQVGPTHSSSLLTRAATSFGEDGKLVAGSVPSPPTVASSPMFCAYGSPSQFGNPNMAFPLQGGVGEGAAHGLSAAPGRPAVAVGLPSSQPSIRAAFAPSTTVAIAQEHPPFRPPQHGVDNALSSLFGAAPTSVPAPPPRTADATASGSPFGSCGASLLPSQGLGMHAQARASPAPAAAFTMTGNLSDMSHVAIKNKIKEIGEQQQRQTVGASRLAPSTATMTAQFPWTPQPSDASGPGEPRLPERSTQPRADVPPSNLAEFFGRMAVAEGGQVANQEATPSSSPFGGGPPRGGPPRTAASAAFGAFPSTPRPAAAPQTLTQQQVANQRPLGGGPSRATALQGEMGVLGAPELQGAMNVMLSNPGMMQALTGAMGGPPVSSVHNDRRSSDSAERKGGMSGMGGGSELQGMMNAMLSNPAMMQALMGVMAGPPMSSGNGDRPSSHTSERRGVTQAEQRPVAWPGAQAGGPPSVAEMRARLAPLTPATTPEQAAPSYETLLAEWKSKMGQRQ